MRDQHPWRTAYYESTVFTTWRGRFLDAGFSLIVGLLARRIGMAPDLAMLLATGVFLVIGLGEIGIRRLRGPLNQLREDNARLCQQIDSAQQATYRLLHPEPLDVTLDCSNWHRRWKGANPAIATPGSVGEHEIHLMDAHITNRSPDKRVSISLDFVVSGQQFHWAGRLDVPPRESRPVPDLVFLTRHPQTIEEVNKAMRGPVRIIIRDALSGLVKEMTLQEAILAQHKRRP